MLHNQYQLVNNLHPNSIQMEGYIYIDVEDAESFHCLVKKVRIMKSRVDE